MGKREDERAAHRAAHARQVRFQLGMAETDLRVLKERIRNKSRMPYIRKYYPDLWERFSQEDVQRAQERLDRFKATLAKLEGATHA